MTTSDIERRSGQVSLVAEPKSKGLKVESYVFFATASFFVASGVVYGFWTDQLDGNPEWAGLVALILTGLMLAMIATFLWFGSRRLEQSRPEDDPDAEVADGAGDVGFFPAASYWPIALAASAMVAAISIAFWQVWLLVMGLGFLFLALTGWLFEYQRAHASH